MLWAVRWILPLIVVAAVVAVVASSRGDDAAPIPRGGSEPPAPTAERPAGLSEHLGALQRIADDNGGTRAAGTPGDAATADYIEARLRAAGFRVVRQRFEVPYYRESAPPRVTVGGRRVRARTLNAQRAETRRTSNVIGEIGPTRRVVMAGAHLDSVPAGPGMNDNASGVAALLWAAERLADRGLPLRFGFWGAEEIGLVGSRRYVARLDAAERRRIAAYVNLDMVGAPDASPEVYDGAPRIEAALRRHLPRGAGQTRLGGSSDHASFERAGIPVGGIFTGLDDCYHERCDTRRNVDLGVLRTSAQAARAAIADLAR